jgi:hypothetical protein
MFGILKSEAVSDNDSGRIVIVLERPYDFLKEELESVFEEQSEIKVVVDRRFADRRLKKEVVTSERRNCDRRASKGKIGSAIISV